MRFIVILLTGICLSLRAQNIQTDYLGAAQGLSQGFINDIYQDSRGFIWISTMNGLNRYDGNAIKSYVADYQYPWTLKTYGIKQISEDANGLLWISTIKGISVFDPYSERFFEVSALFNLQPKHELPFVLAGDNNQIFFSLDSEGSTGLFVLETPKDLPEMISNGKLRPEKFSLRQVNMVNGAASPVKSIFRLKNGSFAAFDSRDILCIINPEKYEMYPAYTGDLNASKEYQYSLVPLRDGRSGLIFLSNSTENGFITSNKCSRYFQLPNGEKLIYQLSSRTVRKLVISGSANQTAGSSRDLFYQQFEEWLEMEKAISDAFFVDKFGNLWIGTTGYGVFIVRLSPDNIRHLIPGCSVYPFTFLPDGTIWPGVYYSNRIINQRGELIKAPWAKQFHDGIVSLFVSKNGDQWLIAKTTASSLGLFRQTAGKSALEAIPLPLFFGSGGSPVFHEDNYGKIWIAGNGGEIFRIDPASLKTESWQTANLFPSKMQKRMRSHTISDSGDGSIWVGQSGGACIISQVSGSPTFRRPDVPSADDPLNQNYPIFAIVHDLNNPDIVWLGTQGGGLCKYNKKTFQTSWFTTRTGLEDNVINGLQTDSEGYIWMSTNRGISLFDPRIEKNLRLFEGSSPLNIEFNSGCSKKMGDNTFAFGSVNGLFIVEKSKTDHNSTPYSTVVSEVSVNGNKVDPAQEYEKIQFSSGNKVVLTLSHRENNVTLVFSGLPVNPQTSLKYRYRTQRSNSGWIETGSQNYLSLANIPLGSSVIELQCTTANDDWENAPVTTVIIHIKSPWYRTFIAYLIYLILGIYLIRKAFIFYRNRIELQHKLEMGQQEMEQLKSMDNLKTRLFSYVAHEFKTPLTIILECSEKLRKELADKQKVMSDRIVEQGQNMLSLVDEIIDITQMQEKAIKLNLIQGNFDQYVSYLTESFRPLCEFRGIDLSYECSVPDIFMDYDPLRVKYLFSNLMSNALRHTHTGGYINITLADAGKNSVSLSVSDTGEGIAPEDIPHLFDRYFRGSNSSGESNHFGLGLTYTKELTELFGGNLSVESVLGEGSTFKAVIPVTRNAKILADQPISGIQVAEDWEADRTENQDNDNFPRLLVVEDNLVIASYIRRCLSPHFSLSFAFDGQEGWEKAQNELPDIIMTDVVMPVMDGLELTRHVKTDRLTSHIPVVILSARSRISDRLAGQQVGADAYVSKPFNEQELIYTINNLISLQKSWKERYLLPDGSRIESWDTKPAPGVFNQKSVAASDRFVQQLFRVFEENYTREEFDQKQLCTALGISRSQLQRKVASFSDQSAMDLLRNFRLERAAEILENSEDIMIKELAYSVGFRTPGYFGDLFTQKYGVKPSDWKKSKGG